LDTFLFYNGKELQEETGFIDFGACQLDKELGRWFNIDPLAEKYYQWSTYNYVMNNPSKYIDPNGMYVSTDVIENNDGTYTVVGGDAYDGDNGIYVVEKKSDDNYERTGDVIGYSATPHSFYFSDRESSPGSGDGTWHGTIDPNDQSGKNFLNKDILARDPSLPYYMANATGGKKWDFKRTNGTGEAYSEVDDYYRGMPILGEKDGKPIFASARDVGNVAAGLVSGRSGQGWATARIGFDGLESLQQKEFTSESTCTQYAEKLGHRIGKQIYLKTKASRLPGNGHLRAIKISKEIIKLGDL